MTSKMTATHKPFRALMALGLLAGASMISMGTALAGDCPADQVADNAMEAGATMPKDVTDEVISAIDLSSKGDAWKGSQLRMRKLVVQPGGVVPWHSHEARPANILVTEGAITEYRSTCKVPIEHVAGDVTAEFGQLAHWWKNNGSVPVVLYSADILSPETDASGSM
ncbi:cupin domain-containing protein [Mesorhizobium yinganensis]|uniref:cupin domain-containing protein n=1 Tax=Mesorhizobium yinganensis TaxID=3157707 RepID=UPI003CCE1CF9